MKNSVAVLYVNGLGNGAVTRRERLMQKHWQKAGVTFEFARINWYDGQNLGEKTKQVEDLLKVLSKRHKKVVLLGSSAGGSLALNVFAQNAKKKNIYLVNAHGRLGEGNLHRLDYRTLEWAAHLQSKQPSKSFYNSVLFCQNETLPALTPTQRRRILVLKPVTDFVVPLQTMNVPGASTWTTFAFGHKWAGISHLLFCRDLILSFATSTS